MEGPFEEVLSEAMVEKELRRTQVCRGREVEEPFLCLPGESALAASSHLDTATSQSGSQACL